MAVLRRKQTIDFKEAVSHAYDHIVITDPDGKILYANPAVSSTTGFSHEEVIGNTPKLWGGLMKPAFYKSFWRTIKHQKKPFAGEVKNKRKDGSVYTADVRVSPILDKRNNVRYFIGIERDVTQVRRLDDSRNEFISLVSHQLRTPLSTLNWYSEALLDNNIGKLNTEQTAYISELYDATQRMIKLVNDLLNSTRIDFGNIKLQSTKIDMHDVFSDILRDCQVPIKRHHLVIHNDVKQKGKYVISSDRPTLYVIFENIITNAIKYTPSKGHIYITVAETKKDITVSVRDTGYGIHGGDKTKIFDKYFRSESIKKVSTDGTGLGLFITKAFTHSLGGTITFDSSGKGTTFHVTIPKMLKEEK